MLSLPSLSSAGCLHYLVSSAFLAARAALHFLPHSAFWAPFVCSCFQQQLIAGQQSHPMGCEGLPVYSCPQTDAGWDVLTTFCTYICLVKLVAIALLPDFAAC